MTKSLLIAALALCLCLTGCATMVNGPYQTVSVESFPSGAKIEADCGDVPRNAGVTPATFKVRRAAKQCLFFLSLDGYETKEVILEHQYSRASGMNRVFAVPGAIVFGVLGALVGSVVNGEQTGADAGVQAGAAIGTGTALGIDEAGGAFKWVPGKVFVTLVRNNLESTRR